MNQKKKLPPYGDYDNDGAPNWSDCDPRNPDEQGIFKRAVGVITRDKYGQSAEEYAEEKAKLAELKARAEAAGIDTTEVGVAPQVKAVVKKWANVGTSDPGVHGLQKAIYGEQQQRYRVQRPTPQPVQPVQQPIDQPYYPPPEDEYTYKSHYYRKPGYIYLPSVKKPKRHRPRPHQAVNPFKRSKQMFANAGLNARPIKIQCPYCGTINYSYICQKCGARLR